MAYQSATLIVCPQCVEDAWQWVLSCVTPRPLTPCATCVYDEKLWCSDGTPCSLRTTAEIASVMSRLYLTSQLVDLEAILQMVSGANAPQVLVRGTSLDAEVGAVIDSQPRFRYALSEHLAFWTRLATAHRGLQGSRFGRTRPNLLPDDKGPDGLFASIGDVIELEVEEVKSSIGSPRSQLAGDVFRSTGRVEQPGRGTKTGRALEDFWLLENGVVGFQRLEGKVGELCQSLRITTDQALRAGLISRCTYNVTVVADEQYSSADLFEGYEHVTSQVERRVATYIGAQHWEAFAERVRGQVKQTLECAGVW